MCHEKCILKNLCFFCVFGSKTTIFVRQSVFFSKSACFCARFLRGNTNWTKTVHTVLCTTSLETKKSETSIFCRNLAFVDKQQKPDLTRKTKTLVVHIGVFGVLKLVLIQKFIGDV